MLLIKGAKIVDGSGTKLPYKADVLVQENKISAIGKFPNKKADIVIDGLGLYITPGFIDVNTDSDHHLSLFTDPQQEDFLIQGVTTIFGGLCGSSLAPLLSGNLNSIRKWTDTNQINVNWHSLSELFGVLEKNKLGVNFGTLVGHSTIRRGLIGENNRDLTAEEIRVLKKLIVDAIDQGAFGLSTGLGYAHSSQTPYQEIKELAKVVSEKNGIYATHLRNEKEGLLAAVGEAIKISLETGAKTIISHLKPVIGFENDYKKAVELIHQESSVYYDNYPFAESVVPLYTLLPEWARVGNLEVMLSYLESADIRKRLIDYFGQIDGDAIKIAQAKGSEYLIGKTVKEFAENRDINVPEALIQLMLLTNLRALVFSRNINLDLAAQNMERDKVLIASNGASLSPDSQALKHPRFYSTFPRFIEIMLQKKAMSLERAVEKITSKPAKLFGLKNRGLIQEGSTADLNLISNKSGSVKIKHVIVNGQLALSGEKTGGVLAGKVLRKQ